MSLALAPLERAVLEALAWEQRALAPDLATQARHARPESRRNTGAGLLTRFIVDRRPAPKGSRAPSGLFGTVHAMVGRLPDPVAFQIELRQGRLVALHASSYGQDTRAIDFAAVPFEDVFLIDASGRSVFYDPPRPDAPARPAPNRAQAQKTQTPKAQTQVQARPQPTPSRPAPAASAAHRPVSHKPAPQKAAPAPAMFGDNGALVSSLKKLQSGQKPDPDPVNDAVAAVLEKIKARQAAQNPGADPAVSMAPSPGLQRLARLGYGLAFALFILSVFGPPLRWLPISPLFLAFILFMACGFLTKISKEPGK
ncbi:hypothetical protein [Brevundimonas faecalis]|uniref:Uncharacterized protein n=1 Tax=Brevundimonas faecalis TaxID=947378 RepID=A0ABV2R8E7_9CAUL